MREKKIFFAILEVWMLFVAAVYIHKNSYKKIYTGSFACSDALQYAIDDVSTKNAQIRGWCLKPGSNIGTYDIRMILWSEALGYGYVVPAMMQSRADVTEYMDDGCNYERSGFLCTINPKFLKKEAYRILIQYRCDGNNEVADTGKYYIPDYAVTYCKPEASGQLVYCIDNIAVDDGLIEGWCLKQGKDLNHFDMDLVLWNDEKSYGYECPAYMLEDKNITAKFQDGNNYDRARFTGIMDNSLIREGNYKLFIRYQCDGENETADTGSSYEYYKTDVVKTGKTLEYTENFYGNRG